MCTLVTVTYPSSMQVGELPSITLDFMLRLNTCAHVLVLLSISAFSCEGTVYHRCLGKRDHVCPSDYILQQVMSPVCMEHKFDSLRESWDKRKGIMVIYSNINPSCSLLLAPKSLPGAVIVALIPMCGLGEYSKSVTTQPSDHVLS